jgi:hypothetical protein
MAEIITIADLPSNLQAVELIDVMVDGANAKASRIAPCLASTDPAPNADQLAEAILILIGTVKRWAEAGSGALQQQTAGPFSQTLDTRQRPGFNMWPSEIEQLQAICATEKAGAFSIDTAPESMIHLAWCADSLGAEYCSCGADIAGYPIYELG